MYTIRATAAVIARLPLINAYKANEILRYCTLLKENYAKDSDHLQTSLPSLRY
jgi:hypothetical protein